MTIGNPVFLPHFVSNGRIFSRQVTICWSREWAKNQVSIDQNWINSWCQIVRGLTCYNRLNHWSNIFVSAALFKWLLLKPGPGPWISTLKSWTPKSLYPEKPGHSKTWTLKNLNSEKPGFWKTWYKYRIKIYGYFRELCFVKIMRNVIYCFKVPVLTDI